MCGLPDLWKKTGGPKPLEWSKTFVCSKLLVIHSSRMTGFNLRPELLMKVRVVHMTGNICKFQASKGQHTRRE